MNATGSDPTPDERKCFEAYVRKHRVAWFIDALLQDLRVHRPADPVLHAVRFAARRRASSGETAAAMLTCIQTADELFADAVGLQNLSALGTLSSIEEIGGCASRLGRKCETAFKQRFVDEAIHLYESLPVSRSAPEGLNPTARIDELLLKATHCPEDPEAVYSDFARGSHFLHMEEVAANDDKFIFYFDPILSWTPWGNSEWQRHWRCSSLQEVQKRMRGMPPQAVERGIATLRAAFADPNSPVLMHFAAYRADGAEMAYVLQFPAWIGDRPLVFGVGHAKAPPQLPAMLQLQSFWSNMATVTTAYNEDGSVALCNYQALAAIGPHTPHLPPSSYLEQLTAKSKWFDSLKNRAVEQPSLSRPGKPPPLTLTGPGRATNQNENTEDDTPFMPHMPDRSRAKELLKMLQRGEQLQGERVRVLDKAKQLRWHLLTGRQVEAMTEDGAFSHFHLVTEVDITNQVELEQERDRLMQNIFPQKIIHRLHIDNQVIADHYPAVTLLFGDIAGFTAWSASIQVTHMVSVLHRLIGSFDAAARVLGIEKIKTIGDCYFCATGVPQPQSDHACRMLRFALQMTRIMKNLRSGRAVVECVPDKWDTEQCISPGHFSRSVRSLEMRIGMHSGAVVGGVIGRDKFAFDLWGDTVNIASRMESTGVEGHIQLSDYTYRLIFPAEPAHPTCTCPEESHDPQCLAQLRFVPRAVEAKGKGILNTWLLDTAPLHFNEVEM
eukprot:TRINITY_DN4852_c0_g1_i1.p1 TRINITY_DN4852_c0_g1~~TRINITY_DN4852_c0_g1_i1.p1  ORF type:complete len:733 (+),score=102.12 TRINITY_DN4852_c0_g1_i1:29-2200(+)